MLELIPLERGLIAFKAGTSSCPRSPTAGSAFQGRCAALGNSSWLLKPGVPTPPRQAMSGSGIPRERKFDKKRIESYIVHPLIRVSANTKPKARKVLIYGYTKWSHGRVYYDLCKHLHLRGYVVDILDWQINHAAYIGKIIPYYDLFITALDGVRTLVDAYGVPYDRIIALSHHEFDMRMLIEQKGIEVFEKFANYGVVSESSTGRP